MQSIPTLNRKSNCGLENTTRVAHDTLPSPSLVLPLEPDQRPSTPETLPLKSIQIKHPRKQPILSIQEVLVRPPNRRRITHTQNVLSRRASHQRTVNVRFPYQNKTLGSCTTADACCSGVIVSLIDVFVSSSKIETIKTMGRWRAGQRKARRTGRSSHVGDKILFLRNIERIGGKLAVGIAIAAEDISAYFAGDDIHDADTGSGGLRVSARCMCKR